MGRMIAGFVRRNWKVVVLFALFLAMLVLATQDEVAFIYTEF